jgi:[ribosomal protein S18]-alanine N-acetyltransferase
LSCCLIRPMVKKDIPQVSEIDREAFPTMWPPVNFSHELNNRLAHYYIASDKDKVVDNPRPVIKLVPVRSFLGIKWPFNSKQPEDAVITPDTIEYIMGFVGLWIMVDEAHIINIAVREKNRGQGVGELLLISAIDSSTSLKADVVTLEVRASNSVAQNLYVKYGFNKVGVRRGYYTDNKEDAFIMTTDNIKTDSFKAQFRQLKNAHFKRLNEIIYQLEQKSPA